MACDITRGRIIDCKDTIGGLKAIFICKAYNNNDAFGNLVFNGITLAHAPGLSADTIVAGQVSNMFFGTDGSRSEVRLLDMADRDLSDNVRIGMRFTAGVNFAFGSDMVLYS